GRPNGPCAADDADEGVFCAAVRRARRRRARAAVPQVPVGRRQRRAAVPQDRRPDDRRRVLMAGTMILPRSKERPMKRAALVVCVICLAVAGCKGNKSLTQENFDKINAGMSLADVQALLGGPGDEDVELNLAQGSSVA